MTTKMNRKTVRLPDDLIRDAIREKVRSKMIDKRRRTPTSVRGEVAHDTRVGSDLPELIPSDGGLDRVVR